MNATVKCPTCGRPLPDDAPRKMCPACLFEAALSSRMTSGEEEGSSDGSETILPDQPPPTSPPSPGGGTEFATGEYLEDHEILAPETENGAGDGDTPSRTVDEPGDPRNSDNPPGTDTCSFRDNTLLTSAGDESAEAWTKPFDAPTIPGYEIGKVLGRGGMGVVYKAVQQQLKRSVALKMIRGDLGVDGEQLGRFRLEAEAVARLRHPNIVQIYEVGSVGGMPYFSLEMLEGGTLGERLDGAPMPPRQAAELAVSLARGVDAVHEVGIIHRDLKPANVLFDVDGTPKISDFGLAKRLEVEDGPTVSGQVMGTPSYMAPEQAQGLIHEVGTAADIYALGAILYEMLTGRPPFKGPTMLETLHQVVYDDVVPPSRFQSKVRRDLETICLKCLSKEPSKRYATAGDLADDLGRFLSGETIRARPTPAWERAAKWARRRPARAAMLAFAIFTAIGLGVAGERYTAYTRAEEVRVARAGLDTVDDLAIASQQRLSGKLEDARITLRTRQVKLQTERLPDYSRRVDRELREVQRELNAEEARRADIERFDRFRRLRDQALLADGSARIFPAMMPGEGDQGPSPEAQDGVAPAVVERRDVPWKAVRDAALSALAIFPPGLVGPDVSADPLPVSLSDSQRQEVESDRYLLLLVLSEAVALPLPGEDARKQAGEALRLLDRAARLRAPTQAYHLRRASCFQRLGDAASAALERDHAAKLAAVDAFDHLLLGREKFMHGDWRQARNEFEKSLSLKPNSFWARCWLAVAELNSSPPRAAFARTNLTTCLIQQPTYAWLHLLRGSANGQLAITYANAAARLPSNRAENLEDAEARFNDSESDFQAALEHDLDGGFRYALLMNRGVMRFRRERWEAARSDFAQAIALEPGRYNAYASLAQALRKLGRLDEAVERMDRAITLEPKLSALYRGRALARLDSGQPPAVEVERALGDLAESARLEPRGSRDAADDHVRRGRLLLRLDRPDDALAAADDALAIAPDSGFAHVVRVAALLETRRFGEVIDSCDMALAKGAATSELHRVRGLALAARGDYAGAIDDYTHALALHPDDPAELHRNRGWSHLFASSYELARRDFDAVLGLDSADADGHAGRASARVRLGQVREAIADAEDSLRGDGPSPRLLYIAAQTYAQASSRALAEVARRGRPASNDSLTFESRAADLLGQAMERTPADRRAAFWRDVVSRDTSLRPLLHNPRILQWLKSKDGSRL